MPPANSPLRPGDIFRVGRSFPRRRVDEDAIDFLRVHYETDSPGLGHVVEVRDDGVVFRLWGHLFHTPVVATSPDVRPLNRLQRLFAPQRMSDTALAGDSVERLLVYSTQLWQAADRLVVPHLRTVPPPTLGNH